MFTHHASQTEIRQLKVLKERQIRLTLSANKAVPAVQNKFRLVAFVTNRSLQ